MNAWIESAARWPWRSLVLAMLHTLWQGAIVAGLLWVVLRLMRARLARWRYLASLAALVAVVACGMFTWSLIDHGGFSRGALSTPSTNLSLPTVGRESSTALQNGSSDAVPNDTLKLARLPWTTWAGWTWAGAASALILRTAIRTARAQRWTTAGHPLTDDEVLQMITSLAIRLGLHRRIRVRVGDAWPVPAVLGFIWPTLLLPASILAECSPAQLQMIIAHELAHVRRWDYLVNFAQQVIEAVLFFNPAVWWISHQVRTEREACCDAAAVRFTGRRKAAQRLVSFAERIATRFVPAPALAVTGDGGGSLLDRIKRILRPDDRPALPAPWYTAVVALVLAMTGLAVLRAGADVAVATTQKLLTPAERVNQIAEIQKSQEQAEGPARKVTVRGAIRTEDGSALPKIRSVWIYTNSRNHSSSNSATVKPDGSFVQEVDGGSVTVAVDVPEYAPAFAGPLRPEADGTMTPFEVVLGEGFTGHVQLTDPGGKPVEGALVESVYVKGFHVGARKAMTDAQGLIALPHATAQVPARIDVIRAGFEFDRRETTLSESEPTIVQLTPAKLTTGTIVDASSGEPIAGATVKLVERKGFADDTRPPMRSYSPPPVVATTGIDGRFSIDTLRADCRYVFWVSAPKHGSELMANVLAGENNLNWKLGPERVINGRITGDLSRLASVRRGARTGKQISYSNPLELDHSSYEGSESQEVTVKDGVGTFVIRDPLPGRVTITAADKTVRVETAKIPPIVEIDLGPTANAAVPAPGEAKVMKRTVEFRFDIPKDAPPPRGKLRVLYLDPKMNAYNGDNIELENGVARYDVAVPGKVGYDLGEMAGYWIENKMQIDVPPGDGTLVVTIPVVPAGAFHGRVSEWDGSPAESFAISLVEVERSAALANRFMSMQPFNARDGSGNFLLSPVPLGGRYRLVATSESRIAMSEVMPLDAKTPIRQVAMKFDEGIPVRVTVVDASGGPRSGVQLSLHFQAKPSHGFGGVSRATDRSGAYVFEHVNPHADGEYAIRIDAGADYPGRTVPIKIDGQPVPISLGRGLALKGQALDNRDGKPMAKVKVKAHPKYDPAAANRGDAERLTDADGNFHFANLDSGEYWLEVENTVPAGTIIRETPQGRSYTYPDNWQSPARGGQTEAVVLRVIPR